MKSSLQRKFLFPILLGSAVLILLNVLISHLKLVPELRSQLSKRAELMVTTIRAAAEINPGYQDLRLALEEITLQTSGVYGITLATSNPTIIWASSTHPDADINAHQSDMLNLLEHSAKFHLFGEFVHSSGDLVVVTPFKLLTHGVPNHPVDSLPQVLPEAFVLNSAYTMLASDYEGILYLRFNWKEVKALADENLITQVWTSSLGILLIMLLSIATVFYVMVKPLAKISATIKKQHEGDSEARVESLELDEIGHLGNSINQMLEALNQRDRLLRSVVDHLPVGLSLKGLEGERIVQNEAYKASYMSPYLSGSVRESLINERVALQEEMMKQGESKRLLEHFRLGDQEKYFETTVFPILNNQDQIEWMGTLCVDITEKTAKEFELTQLYRAIESVDSGVVICRCEPPEYPIIYVNPAVTQLTGYEKEELLGRSPSLFSQGSPDKDQLQGIKKAITTGESCKFVVRNYRKSGELFWNEFTLSVIVDNEDQITHFVGVQNDVTDRVEAANRIEHLAYFDSLTDIPNRTLFNDRLTQLINDSRCKMSMAAVLYIDLDGFKAVNDTYGHNTGDELLRSTAERIKQVIREQDSLARMGGDEFTALIPYLSSDEVISHLPKVVNRIRNALIEPFDLFGNQIQVSGSIGISVYPKDGDSAEELLMNADHAMYHAKESGKNTYRFFQLEMNDAIELQQRIESGLKEAIRRKELQMYYQPQVSMVDNSVTLEALLRWKKDGEFVAPDVFIPIAEQTGIIDDLGTWVISQVCEDLSGFIRQGTSIKKVALNISPVQFKRQNLAAILQRYLEHYKLDASYLEVEITETAIIDSFDKAKEMLRELQRLGVTIAIDDFGTGYSSLTYLKQLPIDTLKIDRQFIMGLPDNSDDVHIIKAIDGLAQGMGITLLAEGVETQEQYQFIVDQTHCEIVQGFYLSKPMSPEDLQASTFFRIDR